MVFEESARASDGNKLRVRVLIDPIRLLGFLRGSLHGHVHVCLDTKSCVKKLFCCFEYLHKHTRITRFYQISDFGFSRLKRIFQVVVGERSSSRNGPLIFLRKIWKDAHHRKGRSVWTCMHSEYWRGRLLRKMYPSQMVNIEKYYIVWNLQITSAKIKFEKIKSKLIH